MDVQKVACSGAAALVGALLISVTAAPVDAQSLNEPVTVTADRDAQTRLVSYRDLSLATDLGRKTLMHRVHVAVDEVCPPFDVTFSVYDAAWCQHFAWHAARPQIDSALLAAASGQPLAMTIEITAAAR
jgi:UrcA family protein